MLPTYSSRMRNDWVPLSASALVVGAMSLVFGSLLNPAEAGATTAQTLRVVDQDGGRWVAMAVMYLLGSVTLTLGLPSVLTLFGRGGRRLGLAGVAVFSVGAIGTCGYAMLMVFFRAMVVADAVRGPLLDEVTDDNGLTAFLQGWVICFYGGVLLIGLGLFAAKVTPKWVPVLLVLFVVMMPFSQHLGRVAMALQVLGLAVGFTGIAMAAVTGAHEKTVLHEPVF